jgi:hypothetical protein
MATCNTASMIIRRIFPLLASAVLLAAFTGCASAEQEPAAVAEETPKSTIDVMLFCERFGENLTDYSGFILTLVTADVDLAEHRIQSLRIQAMEDVVPADAKTLLAQYADPVYQIQAVIDSGGGNININTDGYKESIPELLDYCIDAGYTAN